MSEPKKPEPGEYWGTVHSARAAIRIIGFDGNECVVRHRDGRLTTLASGNWKQTNGDWKHLPWCTSFDDTEPVAEVWPKYYVSRNMSGYFRRDSTTLHFWVGSDGVEVQQVADASILDCKTTFLELPESEALARLTPKCPECGELAGAGHADVCPMGWVVQDRVPDRGGIDEWRWNPISGGERSWLESTVSSRVRYMHGKESGGQIFEVRCRRKDLPPLPEPVKEPRQQIRLWVAQDNTPRSVVVSHGKPSSLHRELKHDADGFYVEGTE